MSEAPLVKGAAGAREHLVDVSEYPEPRRSARPQEHQIIQPPGVHLRFDLREAEQGLELRGKVEAAVPEGIEQGLYAHGVPGEKEPPFFLVVDSKGEDAVELFGAVLTPGKIRLEQDLGI